MGFLRGGSARSGEVEGTPWKTISLANLSMRPPSAADWSELLVSATNHHSDNKTATKNLSVLKGLMESKAMSRKINAQRGQVPVYTLIDLAHPLLFTAGQ